MTMTMTMTLRKSWLPSNINLKYTRIMKIQVQEVPSHMRKIKYEWGLEAKAYVPQQIYIRQLF